VFHWGFVGLQTVEAKGYLEWTLILCGLEGMI
jgi:hypothetical protein